MWDVDTRDFSRPGVSTIVANALEQTTPGAVVLMHDDSPQAPAALHQILAALAGRGYRFGALPRDGRGLTDVARGDVAGNGSRRDPEASQPARQTASRRTREEG